MYKKYTNKLAVPKGYIHQILLIMRLTTIILILAIMQVSASTSAQRITLAEKNAPLRKVFDQISDQSGYNFIFTSDLLKGTKLVTISVKNTELNKVLEQIFANQPVSFSIEDKTVVVKPKEKGFFENQLFNVSKINVWGRIVDEDGNPLAGAAIFVKGRSVPMSTVTNQAGEFVLINVESTDIIRIRYIGYESRELAVSPNMGEIKLKKETTNLEEVKITTYNTGYQEISKERSAGSFAKPDLNVMLNRTSTPNVLTRLEGLVPGLTTRGPGGLLVRGQSSIPQTSALAPALTSTRPLIVIDGIEFDGNIEQLNMQDVEDINVLKDATSASIWGAKAANGVIVITTKKGKAGDKVKIDYDGYYAFQGRPDLDYVPRMSSEQFITLARELFPQFVQFNKDFRPISQTYGNLPHLQILYDRARNLITQSQADSKLDSLSKLSNKEQIQDLFVRDAATINQTISVSGGGKAHTFYGSINHIGTQSNTPGQQNNQYKVNLNNTFILGKRITASVNADLTNTITKNGNTYNPSRTIVPYQMFTDGNGNPLNINHLSTFKSNSLSDSVRNIYSTRSRINLDYNPIMEQDRAYTSSNGLFARLVSSVKVKIVKGLDFQGTYGYNIGNTNTRDVLDQNNYAMRSLVAQFTQAANATVTPVYNIPAIGGRLNVSTSTTKAWTLRNQLQFNRDWNKHQLSLMAGQQATSSTPVSTTATYYGWDDQLQSSRPIDVARLNAGVTGAIAGTATLFENNVGGGEGRIARTTSYYANLGYTFNMKYTFNASWRIDESNLFGRDKSAQNRPVYSIGGKWSLGNEEFIRPVNWLSRLDLRLTYGVTGNAPFAGAASSYDILTAANNINYVTGSGFLLSSAANTKLTWESTRVYNAGLDFSILKNRISGSIDGYIKKTDDLIGNLATSSFTGYSSVIGNYGSMDNKGIDIGLNSTNIRSRNFTWNSGITFSYNKNKLTELLQNPPTTGDEMISTSRLVGYPLYTRFVYNYGGLNAAGDPQIRLANGTVTSAINVATPADMIYTGTVQPVWSGGIQNTFQYKSFTLSANIVYSGGNRVTNNDNPAMNTAVLASNNFQLGFLNRWKVPGDENRTEIPRYVPSAALENARNIGYYNVSQRYSLNGAYAKLRDVTLIYNLPKFLATKVNAQAVSFRFQVNDLLLWTANEQGMDPEFSRTTRDAQGTISMGAHITF